MSTFLFFAALALLFGGGGAVVKFSSSNSTTPQDPQPYKLARSDYYDSRDDVDEDDAREALSELSAKIEEAQARVDACPRANSAGWHLSRARDWFSVAGNAFENKKLNLTMDHIEGGMFHAIMAQEVVAEYTLHATESLSVAVPQIPPAKTAEDSAAPVTAADTTPKGAADASSPAHCVDVNDSDMQAAAPVYRKLSLLVARTQGVIDANNESCNLSDAQIWIDKAAEEMNRLEMQKNWGEVTTEVEYGLFLARLSYELVERSLTANFRKLEVPDTNWDDNDEGVEEAGDAEDYIREAAFALADARSAMTRLGNEPAVARSHLDFADAKIADVVSQYIISEFDETTSACWVVEYHAGVAHECCETYSVERCHVADFLPSTADEDVSSSDADYIHFEDDDQAQACTDWRQLSLNVAKLQALLDARCLGYSDGPGQLNAAITMVERVNDADDWEEAAPDMVNSGLDFVKVAIAAANKFIAATQPRNTAVG